MLSFYATILFRESALARTKYNTERGSRYAKATRDADFLWPAIWSLKIKWRHGRGLPFATFASLRLCENRRLKKEAYFSQRRKGAKAPPFIFRRPSTHG